MEYHLSLSYTIQIHWEIIFKWYSKSGISPRKVSFAKLSRNAFMQLFDMWWIYLGYLVKADLPPGGFEARARRQRRNEVDRTLQRGRESRSSLGSTACTILPSGQIWQRWQYWKVAPQLVTHFTPAVINNPQYVHTDPPFTPQEVDSQAGLANGNRKIAQILDEEGRGSCYKIFQNPAIVKIDSTPPPPLGKPTRTIFHVFL